MAAQKVQQSFGLRAAGAEVNVGDKQSAKSPLRQLFTHSVIPMREQLTDSRDGVMTHDSRTGNISDLRRPSDGRRTVCTGRRSCWGPSTCAPSSPPRGSLHLQQSARGIIGPTPQVVSKVLR